MIRVCGQSVTDLRDEAGDLLDRPGRPSMFAGRRLAANK